MEERLKAILSSYEGKREELIQILQQVQREFGYLPEEAMLEVARPTGLPESRVYAVATFYTQFRSTPIDRDRMTVCRGTACHVRGAPQVLAEVERQLGTRGAEYSLETVGCMGVCGSAPCIAINREVEARVTPRRIAEILVKEDRR